jgi:hypothetical protein
MKPISGGAAPRWITELNKAKLLIPLWLLVPIKQGDFIPDSPLIKCILKNLSRRWIASTGIT